MVLFCSIKILESGFLDKIELVYKNLKGVIIKSFVKNFYKWNYVQLLFTHKIDYFHLLFGWCFPTPKKMERVTSPS